MACKVLAIHLPQFHTIPENDDWWGKGFTEWKNVKRGKSYYFGHYQPREPLNNNYYDLSDIKVLESQIRLARKFGIYGFCFYHYYFQGKKLLETPIEKYRDYSKERFPYCLIWANQSWARTWYRAENGKQILLEQTYGREKEWKQHFDYLLKFFRDPRYIKINNKPVYIIYLPQDIYCKRSMYAIWNKLAKESGFDGIYLMAMKTTYGWDDASKLYDGYIEFEPLVSFYNDKTWRAYVVEWKRKKIDFIKNYKPCFKNMFYLNNQYSYSYLSKVIKEKTKKSDYKTYAGIFAGWDNTPRKDEEGFIVRHSTPNKFGKLVKCVLELSEQQGKEFIFLNAWNEWSEGAYIEPDKKYRYEYLRELKKAIIKSKKKRNRKKNVNKNEGIKKLMRIRADVPDINKINADKHMALFLLMNQWVKIKQAGINIAEYFERRGYKTIAIYGISYVGERLIDELKNSSVKVKYGIDKREKGNVAGIKILNNLDQLEPVDAIIVTPIFYMNEIEAELSKKISCPILSLDEILYYLID